MDNLFTIYKTDDDFEKSIKEELNNIKLELNSDIKFKLEKDHCPAVSGELAGQVIHILNSDPVGAFINLCELGAIAYNVIKFLKSKNKEYRISKKLCKALALFKLKNENKESTEGCNLDKAIVYGPMKIDNINGIISMEDFAIVNDATGEIGYLIAYAFQKGEKRTRTIWNLINTKGEIIVSWTTQTLTENLPEFFKNN
ncbi:hypothetical protein KCL53_002300 [Clostridium perfringens]|uniref:PRC-barrel domain-containing protein n=1 Tax=Clostridium perfringens F262 TaxID=883064 RepID=A0AAV3FBY8_CLOPF|nr:hypothetical protein [Clostridium perfringens]EHK2349163.1 hypothetical protein [Clostridium perfringens]EIA17024.1 hypothetical protein HA1_08502 [Clostridium perfringens F262]MDM0834522.1 hypothetical protein [Clostridium perfringens]MDU2433663.1 hypothetical protein [Clostridium perfringens]MDU2514954.1 hypothetical protein [Clostridium perfringens]